LRSIIDPISKSLKIDRSALPWRRRDFQLFFFLLLLLSFVPADLGRYDGVIGRIADAGHFWFYAVISLFAGRLTKKPAATAFALAAVAGGIELIQPWIERDGNLDDFLASASGAVVGAWWLTGYSLLWRMFPALVLGSLLMLPIVSRYQSLAYQESRVPELAAFDDLMWRELWASNMPNEVPTSILSTTEGPALRVTPKAGARWAGVVYKNQELDWSAYTGLELVISSLTSQQLNIRIDDKRKNVEFDDRFNRTFELQRGENRFHIPFSEMLTTPSGRRFELDRIKRVYVFLGEKPSAEGFVIEHLLLKTN